MKPISNLDLYFLTKELQYLENNRVDNFYYENDIFYLRIYVKNKGNQLLTVNPGKYIYIGQTKEESQFPSSFVQHLRKYLKNTFITQMNQITNERIIDITIDKKEEDKVNKYHIIIEMFANGNIIFTDSQYNILNSLQKKKFKDRKIIVKEKYELPPKSKLSIFDINKDIFKEEFKESDLSIVKFLAIKLGLGGKFAEEICFLANIDKNLKENFEFDNLFNTLQTIINIPIKAYGLYKEDELYDFIPFDFKSINLEKKEFKTFNDVLLEYYSKFKILTDPKEIKLNQELKKLQNRLEKQEKQKQQIEIDYEKYNTVGNKIYESYQLIENLLIQINTAGKEKGWEYVKKTIKENPELKKLIKTLNYKNNEIILNIE